MAFDEARQRPAVDAKDAGDRTVRDPLRQQLLDHRLLAGELGLLGVASLRSSQPHTLALPSSERLLGAGRDHRALNLRREREGKRQDLGRDGVAQLVALLGGEHLGIELHDPVEDAHDLQDGAAKTGELGNNEHVIRLQLTEELAELALFQMPGRADGLLDLLADGEALLVTELQDLEALVLGGLSVSADPDVAVDHNLYRSLSLETDR